MDRVITITLEEYRKLVEKAERIAVVGRMLDSTSYVNVEDIRAILGIDERKENENETV